MAESSLDDNNDAGGKNKKRWFPLESNPSLMNQYVGKLGFDTSLYEFVDVFSTEGWALDMVPQPAAAVIMLYPLTEVQRAHAKQEKSSLDNANDENNNDDNVWFVKQRIGNACGTIGLLHALFNTPEGLRGASLDPNSWLGRYYNDCPPQLSPLAKAERLEEDDTIENLHDDATSSSENQTSRGTLEQNVLTHFVALVHVKGGLYELDGRKEGPVRHGNTNEVNLLKDACRVVQEFMKRDPEEMRFTILALAPKQIQDEQ